MQNFRTLGQLHAKERERERKMAVIGTDEQYILYCIEIPYQKLGLYWYWLIFQNSAIPIPNQYQQKLQFKKYFRQHSVLFNE